MFICLGIWSGRNGKPATIVLPILAVLVLFIALHDMLTTPESARQTPPGQIFNPSGMKLLGDITVIPLVATVFFFISHLLGRNCRNSQKFRRPFFRNTGYQKTARTMETPADPAPEDPAKPEAYSRDLTVLTSENETSGKSGSSEESSDDTGDASEKIREDLVRLHLLKNDILTFGRYCQDDTPDSEVPVEWIVLNRQEHEILAVSRFVLECRPYSDLRDSEYWDTWSSCSLRTWLNREFLNRAFNPAETALITDSSVLDDTSGTYARDRVFCLSQGEFNGYLAGTSFQKGIPTPHAIARGTAVSGFSGSCSWWLRDTSDFMSHGGEPLTVDAAGFRKRLPGATRTVGVRPAIRITL